MHTVVLEFAYFKPSGKFYTEGQTTVTNDGTTIRKGLHEISLGCDVPIYPKGWGVLLRDKKMLPGLQSGFWSGPFIVRVNGGYWELCPEVSGG